MFGIHFPTISQHIHPDVLRRLVVNQEFTVAKNKRLLQFFTYLGHLPSKSVFILGIRYESLKHNCYKLSQIFGRFWKKGCFSIIASIGEFRISEKNV